MVLFCTFYFLRVRKTRSCDTMRGYKKEYLAKDIFTGIIIAAVSVPISMGYAEVAGLPAVYGLYGSVLPILLFAYFFVQAYVLYCRAKFEREM